MIERRIARDLDVPSIEVLIEALGIPRDIEITPCEPVFVQFDLPGVAHVHEVLQLREWDDRFERNPVRLAYSGSNLNRCGHLRHPPTTGGMPRWVCLQPTQQTASASSRMASSRWRGG